MDEISIMGKTKAAILDEGNIKVVELHPEDFGLEIVDKDLIIAPESLEGNLEIAMDVLEGKRGNPSQIARMDICLANAGAILFISGRTSDLKKGVELSRKTIEDGSALRN